MSRFTSVFKKMTSIATSLAIACTLIAIPPGQTSVAQAAEAQANWAVYSADDGSLTFAYFASTPTSQAFGKTVTASWPASSGWGSGQFVWYGGSPWSPAAGDGAPWRGYAASVRKIEFRNRVQPKHTDYWFLGFKNALLTYLDASKLDLSACVSSDFMFFECSSLLSIIGLNQPTGSLESAAYMFYGCSSLSSLDLSKWTTNKVWNYYYMFSGCKKLTSLDISGWSSAGLQMIDNMFSEMPALSLVKLGSAFKFTVTSGSWAGDYTELPTPQGAYFTGWWTNGKDRIAAGQFHTKYVGSSMAGTWTWERKTYTISYNNNGRGIAPDATKKTAGIETTISSKVITAADEQTGSVRVTYDTAGGSCAMQQASLPIMTSYKLAGWSRDAAGITGTLSPGSRWIDDSNTTLFAQWISTSSYPTVYLPDATRDGYIFQGWCDSSGNSVSPSYVVRNDMTLHATWRAADGKADNAATISGVHVPEPKGAANASATLSGLGFRIADQKWTLGGHAVSSFAASGTYSYEATIALQDGYVPSCPLTSVAVSINGFATTVSVDPANNTIKASTTFVVNDNGSYSIDPFTHNATFVKASKSKKSVVIASATDDLTYKVTRIAAGAFSGSKATKVYVGKNVRSIAARAFAGSKVKTVVLYTDKIARSGAKGSLSASKVKTVKVNISRSVKKSKKSVKKYKKVFTKKNCGKKIKVKLDR